jgi:hypothetical protein
MTRHSGDIHERLYMGARLLHVIEVDRERTGDPGLKRTLERAVIDRELDELAAEWASVLWGE